MDTEQFNMRLSKELLGDIEFIAALLKLSKSQWIKTKLAESVHDEKHRLLMKLSTLYSHEGITREELERLIGKKLADELEKKKKMPEAIKKPASYIH